VLTHFSWTSQIAVDILATILTTIIWIIALIFTFLFYKDLQKEYNDSQAQFLTKWNEWPNEYGPDRLQEKPVQKLQPTEDQVL
jgi:hypothetical protein